MITSVDDWVSYLKDINLIGGFPLVIGGLVFMLFGWRMWKVCVVLSFGALGAVLTARLAGPGPDQWFYALCGAAILGIGSYFSVKYSIMVLGGLIMSGVTFYFLGDGNMDAPILYAALSLAMCGGVAYSAINRQRVVIFVTSLIGALLLVSGMTTWLTALPGLFGTFQGLAADSTFVIPFIIIVPCVMSTFYQIAEVRRLQVDL